MERNHQSAAPKQRSRFRDAKGHSVSFGDLLVDLPRGVATAAALKLSGLAVLQPIISYPALRLIRARLRSTDRVLEYGSGRSTVWLARQVRSVVSVEHHPEWRLKVAELLREKELTDKVSYTFAETPETYVVPATANGEPFDFVFIDGMWRDKCVDRLPETLKPGGFVYLDDSDADCEPSRTDAEMRRAECQLRAWAMRSNYVIVEATGFFPTGAHCKQGLFAFPGQNRSQA